MNLLYENDWFKTHLMNRSRHVIKRSLLVIFDCFSFFGHFWPYVGWIPAIFLEICVGDGHFWPCNLWDWNNVDISGALIVMKFSLRLLKQGKVGARDVNNIWIPEIIGWIRENFVLFCEFAIFCVGVDGQIVYWQWYVASRRRM